MRLLKVSGHLASAGLVGLIALDVVLVGAALRSNSFSVTDAGSISSAETAATAKASTAPSDAVDGSTSTSSPSSGPSKVAPVTAAAGAAPLQVMLVAIDDRLAWRVRAGSCSAGGATLATTSDGGTTWVDGKTPLRSIVRIRPSTGQTAFVVGAGSDCVADLKSTTDGGGTWGSTTTVGAAWFRDPKNATVVGGPGTVTAQPCADLAVLDLAALSPSAARVLCADGRVRSTANTGSSWTDSGQVSGAVALAVPSASPAQTYVARLDAPDCAGVQVERVDQTAATSCVKTAVPTGAGQISLSLVGGGGWLAIGETTMRSTDDLVTWSVS